MEYFLPGLFCWLIREIKQLKFFPCLSVRGNVIISPQRNQYFFATIFSLPSDRK